MAFLREHESWGGTPPKNKKKELVTIGGQALIEGIMMKGPKGTAVSVRLPNGSIETEIKNFKSLRNKYKFFKLPLIRGVVSFFESLIQGYRLLMESAEKSVPQTDQETESEISKAVSLMATVCGIGLSVLLFLWTPSLVFDTINKLTVNTLDLFRAPIEGIMRVIIFVSYLGLTSLIKDMKRVYMYHGAEHKTISCFEHGHELTVENIKKEKRFHPRCGTSFIFVTIIFSIIISSIVSVVFPEITSNRIVWVTTKLLMMPLIMGIGFEFIQYAGKHPNKLTSFLSAPGLLMQRITTKEPTDDMIEVAIAAVKAAILGKTEKDFFYIDELGFPYENHETTTTPENLGIELNNGQSVVERLSDKKETHNEFLKKGAAHLCEEHPDIVQDIIQS